MATLGLPFLFCIDTLLKVDKHLSEKFRSAERFIPEFILLLSFLLCCYQLDLNWFNSHMSRDILRSQTFNLLGPELGWDYKRLPGPVYYWFLGLLALTQSLYFILLSKLLALFGTIYLLLREIRRNFAPEILTSFLSLFLFMPVFIFTSRNLWNPSLVVLFNCLQLFFLLRFNSTPERRWIFWSLAAGIIGLQVHFSTIIGFLAFGLSVLLDRESSRSLKKMQAFGLGIVILWLGFWFFADYVPEFNHQIKSLYGFSSFGFNRLIDFASTLTLNLTEIQDYDLFTLFFRSLGELGLIDKPLVLTVTKIFFYFYLLLFAFSFAFVTIEFKKHRRQLDLFLLLYTILFLVSILIFRNKANIPYRYGLALFPVQFFLISYGLYIPFRTRKFYPVFSALAGLTLIFYFYFNLQMLQAQKMLGRAHHTNYDNLELSVRNKQHLYSFLMKNTNLEGDPFNFLHGRTANKFRLKEMNWEQTLPYYSLYYLSTGRKFNFSEALKDTVNSDNWLVQLKNLQELKDDPGSALKITELSSEAFPKNLKIQYLSADRKLVQAVDWKNTSLILPSAFVSDMSKIEYIRMQFELDTTIFNYINILIDDNEDYGFAYRNNYEILKFKTDQINRDPMKMYNGFFLVQNQYIFSARKNPRTKIELEMVLKNKYRNYSRIDIFSTGYVMSEEELFPKIK